MSSHFAPTGSGATPSYFDQDWSGGAKCKLVTWQTGYSLYVRDDYKRCICDKFGRGASDCKTQKSIFSISEEDELEILQ